MFQESDLIPYHISPPPGERVLVIAPHPDDETLGCGGTIRLLVEAKRSIKVVFLTSGDKADPSDRRSNRPVIITPPTPFHNKAGEGKGTLSTAGNMAGHITEYSLMREKEAEKALKVLGVSDYEFLRFPDRELYDGYEDVLRSLVTTVDRFRPDALYAPSMLEVNPDHRAASGLALEMQRVAFGESDGRYATCGTCPFPLRIVFYEVSTPLRPNVLVDVTSVYRVKRNAVKKYKSQLRLIDYLRHVTAMNTIRALTVGGSRYVEAFWTEERPLTGEEIDRWVGYAPGAEGGT